MVRVEINNAQDVTPISRTLVRRAVRAAAAPEWGDRAVSVALVDAEAMSEINARFTGRSEDADVLAFPLDDGADALVGEVVVSASRAVAEAAARGIDPVEELILYVVHGALHLQGYDDHTTADRRKMYARERQVLAALAIGDVRRARKPSRNP